MHLTPVYLIRCVSKDSSVEAQRALHLIGYFETLLERDL